MWWLVLKIIIGVALFMVSVLISTVLATGICYNLFRNEEVKVQFIDSLYPYTIPKKGSKDAAAFDLSASWFEGEDEKICSKEYILHPGHTVKVHTNLRMELPEHTYLDICSRSGMSINKGLVVINSPARIDSDYRGEIIVGLHNLSDKSYTLNVDDRIAQCTLHNLINVEFIEDNSDFSETERADGGLGHSGE